MIEEHHLPVTRTARYLTVGSAAASVAEWWIVLHGYGQLAGRLLRHFEPLASPERLIVAPEGLSRFYVESVTSGPAAQRSVGASWMTREDRLHEIDDYIAYLNALYAHVRKDLGARARCSVFAFSQGTATACRWLANGAVRPDRLILWAGELPPDLDFHAASSRFATLDITVVAGRSDELITPKIVARDTGRLTQAGIPFRLVDYEGGHQIEAETLREVMRPQ